jgi:rhodanese-related sulfurtransferase
MKKRLLYTLLGLSLALGAQQKAAEKGNPQTMTHTNGFLKLVDDAKSRIKQIDIEGYKKMVAAKEPHVLVDTREDSEWADGHMAGAVHLSRGIIERDIETRYPDKTTKLVLYCGGGFRSALAADSLQKMGYTNVVSLDGGWRALKDSGLPLEK